MFLTIFDKNTGEVLRHVTNPFATIADDCIEGHTPTDCYINIATKAIIQMPLKPSAHHIFDYTTKQWTDPRTNTTQWPIVRRERDHLLLVSDWTQLPDVPLATKEAWAVYQG